MTYKWHITLIRTLADIRILPNIRRYVMCELVTVVKT